MRAIAIIAAFFIAGLFWTLWQDFVEPSGLTHVIGVLIAVGFFFWAWDWSKRFSRSSNENEKQSGTQTDNKPAKSLSDIPTSETPTKVPPQRLKPPSPNPQTTINYKAFGIALAVLLGFIALGVILEESFDTTAPPRTTGQTGSDLLSWESNDPRVVSALRQWAEVGASEAQFKMGLRYYNGEGVIQDYSRAFCWFQHASNATHPIAMSYTGLLYENGQGVEKDLVLAHKWYNLAAARGRDWAAESRTRVAGRMNRDQIEQAQSLAREWTEELNPFLVLQDQKLSSWPGQAPDAELERKHTCD